METQFKKAEEIAQEAYLKMLEELAVKVKSLNELPKFDSNRLSKYYSTAEKCIKLQLIQETIKYNKRLE